MSYRGVLSLSVGDESGNEGLTYGQLSFARAAVLLRWGIDHKVSHDRRRPVVVGLPLRYVALPDNLVVVLASVSIDTTFCLWLLRAHLRVILHHASRFFVHFFPVFARLRLKCLILRFMEDVNKQGRNFISLSELGYGPLIFSFRRVCLHVTK